MGCFPLLEEKWEWVEDSKWEMGSLIPCVAAPGWEISGHLLPCCWGSDYSDAPLYFKA